MPIKFERIIPTENQIDELFFLLNSRKYSISHTTLPSKKDHSYFVSENPYVIWYLIYTKKNLIGSVYLHTDNSIGIDLMKYSEDIISSVIQYIKKHHKPLPLIKSVRRDEFSINVSCKNTNLIKILKNLNKHEIQRSFLI